MKKIREWTTNTISAIAEFFDNRAIILSIFFIVVGILILPRSLETFYNLKVGDVAPKTIRATVSMLVEDKDATKNKIEEAISKVAPVFDYDSSAIDNIVLSINEAEKFISLGNNKSSEDIFFKTLKIKPNKSLYNRILKCKPHDISYYSKVALYSIKGYYIINSTEQLYKFSNPTIVVRDIKNPSNEKSLNKNSVIDISRAKIIAYNKLKYAVGDPVLRNTIWDLISNLILPNLTFNSLETKNRKEEKAKEINHVFFKISKGEIIVRSGDIITTTDYLKLNALQSIKQKENVYAKFAAKLFIFILISLMLYRSYRIVKFKKSKILKENTLILVLESLVVLQMLIFKFFSYISNLIAYSSPDFPKIAIIFGMPFAFASIMCVILVDFESSFLISILMAISAWLVVDSAMNSYLILYIFVGSMVGIIPLLKEKSRADVVKSGLYVSAGNIVMIAVFYMFNGSELNRAIIFNIAFGILGGILTAIIASGLLPIFEYIFNITTDIKLLELGNLNNQLLKELAIKAPGTYHHSIVVSSLAEAAASQIGANSLIAKVGSYYHDIGKLKNPIYFVENQTEGINPHDKLKPSISALIIKNHVKYGLEIAKKNRLGIYIMSIIAQHHGTSLIKYFFNKAKENGQNPNEEEFRYPGPKPQTKEAGIVMIADEVEAASKTLSNPTVSHLTDFVREITNKIFLDGQLDECELTLKDLNIIVDSFVNVLVGIFHHRIEYPEGEKVEYNDN